MAWRRRRRRGCSRCSKTRSATLRGASAGTANVAVGALGRFGAARTRRSLAGAALLAARWANRFAFEDDVREHRADGCFLQLLIVGDAWLVDIHHDDVRGLHCDRGRLWSGLDAFGYHLAHHIMLPSGLRCRLPLNDLGREHVGLRRLWQLVRHHLAREVLQRKLGLVR